MTRPPSTTWKKPSPPAAPTPGTSKEAAAFLPAGTACASCGGKEFDKGKDILDVWFESGSSHGILQSRAGHRWPADMYLEGGDQYRGWFHSSLLVGISAMDGRPLPRGHHPRLGARRRRHRPCTSRWATSSSRRDIIKDKGAEILRLWAAMVNYQEDVRFSDEMLPRLSESYRKIRNTWRFMLGVLSDFSTRARRSSRLQPCGETDRYILQRLQEIKARVLQAYHDFEYHAIFHALFNFFTVRPERLLPEHPEGQPLLQPPGRPANAAPPSRPSSPCCARPCCSWRPILSFTCEEAWGYLPDHPGKEPFIHLERFPAGRRTPSPGRGCRALGEDHGHPRPHPEGDRVGPRRQAHRRFAGSRHRGRQPAATTKRCCATTASCSRPSWSSPP